MYAVITVNSSRYIHFFTAIFVTTLIAANTVAVKIGAFGSTFLPVAVIVFPISYILSDVITEVYGFRAMRRVIWTGFACNAVFAAVVALALFIPPAPFFAGQDAFVATLSATPRILGASFLAYLVGEFANATILAKLKIHTKGKHLWLRTIGSTIIGEGLDSALFISLAFIGVFPQDVVLTMIVTQWLFKVAFEILATPVTYVVTHWLKKSEGIDTYDKGVRFNPFSF